MLSGGASLSTRLRARGSRFGEFILACDRTGSTNALASDLARAGAPHGSLVLAEQQARGKGRWNRRWESPPGGLYLSVVLRPPMRPSLGLLPLAAAVAAAEAVAEQLEHETTVELRWPNDLYARGRKMGGVLCESSFAGDALEHAIVGIGLNLNREPGELSEEVRSRATSVRALVGRSVDVLDTAAAIVTALERVLASATDAEVVARFRELAPSTSGAEVRVVSREGVAADGVTGGVAEDGGLRVRFADGGSRTLHSEDVLFLRSSGEG